ncbi:MAG: chitobiase/beta-hexosaminidase C-terminal domain-containing protein [Clostridiales bacterium]|nr:chitobiase/beta-hexosaminidase C-terminal domain-containing protein [Clostridiales bacterium]MDY2872851.1 chitobiase/beta-hexosaminidase C-terminal domain-containing protein [Eubacteriales bacterium]
MKCRACGEENSPNARYCSYCGAKLTAAPASEAETKQPPVADAGQPAAEAPRSEAAPRAVSTAQPLSDNPYQPRRMPTIYDNAAQAAHPVSIDENTTPAPKRAPVFLFDDEKEEEELKRRRETALREAEEERRELARKKAEDPFYGEEDDEDYDDEEDEEESSHRGRVITAVISIVTILLLCVALYAFLFYTSMGSRLRAYYGVSAGADDYICLADWQLEQGNATDATASYYNAFRLKSDDYDFVLKIAGDFENCRAYERAEQTYMYLIENYPDADDPYDNLMALLIKEGKTNTYNALIAYRAEHQSGYVAPAQDNTPAAVQPPVLSPESGEFTGTVKITISAAENAAIHFTVDGSDPTEASPLYSGAITLYSGSYTLKAVAIAGGVSSEIVSASYSVS